MNSFNGFEGYTIGDWCRLNETKTSSRQLELARLGWTRRLKRE